MAHHITYWWHIISHIGGTSYDMTSISHYITGTSDNLTITLHVVISYIIYHIVITSQLCVTLTCSSLSSSSLSSSLFPPAAVIPPHLRLSLPPLGVPFPATPAHLPPRPLALPTPHLALPALSSPPVLPPM